jgi:two-component system cell cycle sensor histidine kinase/response regulator CckA
MSRSINVLLIGVCDADRALIEERLRSSGYTVQFGSARGARELADVMGTREWSLQIIDVSVTESIPGLVETVRRPSLDTPPSIVLADRPYQHRAAQLMKMGASDYVLRDDLERLPLVMERELSRAHDRKHLGEFTNYSGGGEERFRQLAEHSKDIIFQYRLWPTVKVEYVSSSIVKLTGQLPEYFYQDASRFTGLYHPEDWPFLEASFRSDVTTNDALTARWIVRNGKVLWTEQSLSRQRDRTGRIVAVEGFVRNVTRRVEMEQALQKSEQRLKKVFQSVADPMFVWTVGGTIQEVNPATGQLLGYPSHEIVGKSISQFLDVNGMGDTDILRTDKTLQQLDVFLRPRGDTPIPASLNLSPMMDPMGRVIGMVGVARDMRPIQRLIAEARAAENVANARAGELAETLETLRETQAQLIQSSKMASLAQLSAGISHKFNNLLNIVSGYSDMLIRRSPADAPAHNYLAEIKAAVKRATALVQELQLFARRQPSSPVALDVSAEMTRLDARLRALLPETVTLQAIHPTERLVVQMDPAQLDQILVTLCLNARDAMPEGGVLKLEMVHRVTTAEEGTQAELPAGDYVMIAVHDTGRGMTDEVRAHLFEPFFTTKGLAEGTGLGLATCYGMVRQAGGHFTVESEPGIGSVFRIFFPRVFLECPAPPPATEPQPEAESGHETILLVEDEAPLRAILALCLRARGYTVLESCDGLEALEVKEKHGGIDLLVTDVMMPRMGGRELAERLRRQRADLPVLFMSGYTGDELASRGILQSNVALIEKPFAPDELIRNLKQVLASCRRPPLNSVAPEPAALPQRV